jgi:urease accessory protein
VGGFAHSGGLEAACQHGEVRGPAELEAFIRASLSQLGRGMLPFMTAAYRQPGKLEEFDQGCHTFLINHVTNRASRLQGRALHASATRIFGQPRLERDHRWPACPAWGHLATVFGILARALELERTRSARMFLFWHLRGWLAGAVRLGVVGPLEAQATQSGLGIYAEEVLDRCADLNLDDISQTAPLLDLWQGSQDRLYSRLFQS